MIRVTRRGFLAATAATSVAIRPWAKVMAANSDIRVAIIGANGIGRTHLFGFPKVPGVRVVGLCDVDSQVLGTRSAEFTKEFGEIKKYSDLREVYDDPNVDAVVLAVPNHWHALGTVWGCQAGKDVYVEKPCSYNIWEAGQMIKAAEKYQRIVQVGIQRRSLPYMQEWLKEIREGALGKITRVRALFYSNRKPIGKVTEPQAPPTTVNHDLWSGPAPTLIMREKYHYDWHWNWETGNGELGNNGPHVLDLARTVLGVNAFPEKVWSMGDRYVWDDNGVTPNAHIIHYGYEPAPIIMEIRNLPVTPNEPETAANRGVGVGIVVEGEEGTYIGFDKGKVYDKEGKEVRTISGDVGPDGGRQFHRENFIAAVRSRKTEDLNCSVPQGHLSSSLCHLGNISHRLGKSMSIDAANEQIQSEPLFGETGQRLVQHLKDNKVSTDKTAIELGAALTFDPQTQTFPTSPDANALLKRNYRAPYVVPENV